ncbi:1801_t:CDS:2, partial [Racocetra persica]
ESVLELDDLLVSKDMSQKHIENKYSNTKILSPTPADQHLYCFEYNISVKAKKEKKDTKLQNN